MARLARVVELSLGEVDLSLSQFRLLVLLAGEPTVASKLAEYLAVSPPSVTAVVDGLVARGLVERRADSADRRRVEHALTEDGRALLERADDVVEARLLRGLGRLPRGEAAKATDGLRSWQKALDADRAARKAEGAGRTRAPAAPAVAGPVGTAP
jgi:DNA-binding MarR family transcriptional regulator